MTPRICPTSPRPRLSQPSTRATFSPAVSRTAGNHVKELTISGYPSCRGRQALIGGWVHDRDVTTIDVTFLSVVDCSVRVFELANHSGVCWCIDWKDY